MAATKNQVSTRLFRISTIALTLATFAQHALCGQFDWPQWQGPDRNAVSKETGLLKEWPKDGPPLAWRIVADGRIYYRNDTEARGATDEMILIEPSRKEYLERGRFRIPDPSGVHSWSHPVIANGKLYVRDQGDLFCYDVKAK